MIMTSKNALLTTLCFRENDLNIPPVDLIFVFGSVASLNELTNAIRIVIIKTISPRIIFTGGTHNSYDTTPYAVSSAKQMYEESKKNIPNSMQVLLEEKSSNTLENVLYSIPLLPQNLSSLCFTSKSYHAGRAYLTLRKYFPNTRIFQQSFDPLHPKTGSLITRDNWHETEETREYILGEFQRIKKYGERGDIEFEEIRNLMLALLE